MLILNVISDNRCNMDYTEDDTFDLTVTTDGGFSEGSTLEFIIAKSEDEESTINNTYNLSDDGFLVTLDSTDREKLNRGDYIYKLILRTPSGSIETYVSGDFRVKWGA